jgi:molybdopterin-guanine dinucleotide biosynthesis protein A
MATRGLSAQPAVIVLVGGRSTRMGTDKASLVVGGVAMRDRVLDAVAAAGLTTTVIAGSDEVPDAVPDSEADGRVPGGRGPLAGVVGAWEMLQQTSESLYDPIVVLACDLPWLVSDVIAELLLASGGHVHGAVAHDGERRQPLVAAYRPAALDEMMRSYHAGERSLRRCSLDWDLAVVHVDPKLVADADTPEDLAGFVVEWPG